MAAPYLKNQIVIKGDLTRRHEEAKANAALSPGHLIELISTGKIQKHATSGGFAEKTFAKENYLHGDNRDTAYAENDMVGFHIAQPGDYILARLPASATAVVIGSYLMSNGDGCLALRTSTNVILAIAMEAVDNSAGSGEVFIVVRVV